MENKFIITTSGVLILTACLIYFLGLTAGLALVGGAGLAYLFIGMIKAVQDKKGLDWAIVDIIISIGLGFTGTILAGLVNGGATGLLAGLIVSIYLSCNIKGRLTVCQLLLSPLRRGKNPKMTLACCPRPDD